MILVVDIGNTSVTLGAYSAGSIQRMGRCRPTATGIGASLLDFAAPDSVGAVAVASVVPGGDQAWAAAIRSNYSVDPFFITCACNLGVAIDYAQPEKIGADRLANAAAAYRLFGAPVVVADFGTALTFDIVARQAAYVGGVIAPGLPLMFEYLAERTELLPKIAPAVVDAHIGRTTEEAMQIGARAGYRGMVRGILGEIASEIGHFAFCATGGYAEWVLSDWDGEYSLVPDLTLQGVGHIYDLNNSGYTA